MTRRIVSVLGVIVVSLCASNIPLGVDATPDDNNSYAEAIEVWNNDVIVETLDDTDDLSDFYKIYLEAGEIIWAFLDVPLDQDFDFYLYDSAYALINSSEVNNPGTDQYYEELCNTVPSSGWYYLEAYAYSGSGSYVLWVFATAQWTVMVYLDGDCDLEYDALVDFMEMSSVGSTAELNIVVQLDRIPGYDGGYGDWTGCERFFIMEGMPPESYLSSESLGEVNMADPQTLIDFGVWAIEWFPAHHYALVLWDHGGSWYGVCWDESEVSGDCLTMSELSEALSGILSATSLPAIDVVWFDACNMASIEVACQIDDYCLNIVGSENAEPDTGANYALTLSALAEVPTMTPAEFCTQIVNDYVDSYDSTPELGYSEADVTQSASNSNTIGDLVCGVDALAGELLANMTAYVNYVNRCWLECEYYDYDYLDLFDFCRLAALYLPEGLARSLASSVMDAVTASVFAERHWDIPGGDIILNAHGITVYFPDQMYYDASYGAPGIEFSTTTQWDEFLTAYYSAMSSANNPPSIQSWSPLTDPTIEEGQSVEFQVDASDPDGNALSYLWMVDSVEVLGAADCTYDYSAGFEDQGVHTVSLQVSDGAEYDQHDWTLTVIDVPPNTPPVAAFTVTPPSGDTLTTFSFDASDSTDLETPLSELEFRWDWNGDGTWDTDWLTDATASHQFMSPATYTVCLEVNDTGGLTNTTEATVEVASPNTSPIAAFTVSPGTGDTLTVFLFNASTSTDVETPLSELEFRWDWDGDGTWDTDWLSNPLITHQFTSPDSYTICLEVRDVGGLTGATEQTVEVSEMIPEFPSVIIPVLSLLLIVLPVVMSRHRKNRS